MVEIWRSLELFDFFRGRYKMALTFLHATLKWSYVNGKNQALGIESCIPWAKDVVHSRSQTSWKDHACARLFAGNEARAPLLQLGYGHHQEKIL